MPTAHEPELHVIRFPAGAGEKLRAQAERHRAEARTRYLAHLSQHLSESDAAIALDALTVWNNATSSDRCGCSCHPRLPESDLHDYGFDCPCRQTPDTRRRYWDEWIAERDEFWASPEGEQITAEREAEEAELTAWLTLHPDVVVRSHGGMFPEQWWGEVDGRSFYFRERNDHWRIELDLRPTGQFSKVWVGGEFDDPASFEPRSIDVGEIITEGTTAAPGYGQTPLDRLHFIVDVIRAHVLRQSCTVHIDDRASLESLLGRPAAWCPSCGIRVSPAASQISETELVETLDAGVTHPNVGAPGAPLLHRDRRHSYELSWPIEGGARLQWGHTQVEGLASDVERDASAWGVLDLAPLRFTSGEALLEEGAG